MKHSGQCITISAPGTAIYSTDKRDLSCAPCYADFCRAHADIIKAAVARLARDHFACFVVGEIRNQETGVMRNFVGDTVHAFQEAGASLYNHAVMLLPLHTAPLRAPGQFTASAKLAMCHQHVLVFFKGRNPNRDIKRLQLANATRQLEWH